MEIKTVNRNRIYRMIYQNPRISRPELCHRLGLSMPTVMQNVRYLQDRGLVEEGGSLDSTGRTQGGRAHLREGRADRRGAGLGPRTTSAACWSTWRAGILAESREKRAFAVSGRIRRRARPAWCGT